MLGYLHLLHQVLLNNGVPQSIYSDRHTIFKVPDKFAPSIEEELAGMVRPLTQYGQALHKLKITHIAARTPQAKSRVERLWGSLQHRLRVELRLANIATIADANAFLPGFVERHNKRFAVAPAIAENAYRPSPSPKELVAIWPHAPTILPILVQPSATSATSTSLSWTMAISCPFRRSGKSLCWAVWMVSCGLNT